MVDFEINKDAIEVLDAEEIRGVIRKISEKKILEMNSIYKKCSDGYSKTLVMEKIGEVMDVIYEFSHCNVEYKNGIPFFENSDIKFPFNDLSSRLENMDDSEEIIYYRGHSLEMFHKEFSEHIEEWSVISNPYTSTKNEDGEDVYTFLKTPDLEELLDF